MATPETLQFVRQMPLAYGTWRELKSLYKSAEAEASDPTLMGALLARLDAASLSDRLPAPPSADLELSRLFAFAVRNSRAFLVSGDYSQKNLSVWNFDVSDPLKPEHLGSVRLFDGETLLLLDDGLGVFGRGDRRRHFLELLDVSNPARPTARGRVELTGLITAAADGNRLCAAVNKTGIAAFEGLRVIDASNLDEPKIVGEVKIESVNGVATAGNLACVTVGRVGFGWTHLPKPGGLRVVDLTDGTRPKIIGSLSSGDVSAVAMTEKLVLLGVQMQGGNPAGLHVIEISDPAKPRTLGTCALVGNPKQIVLRGELAYVVSTYGPTQIVSLSDPENPKIVGKLAQNVQNFAIDGTRAYLTTGWNGGLSVANLEHPETPTLIGTPPSAQTLGYMKRRGRRFLRQTAKKNPDAYVNFAFEILRAATGDALQIDRQWILTDILFGGATRFSQTRHGRGGYKETVKKRAVRTREERAADAWNRRPELAAALFSTPDLPWQTSELALKILRDAHASQLDLDDALLRRFLQSPSPLLVSLATRQAAAQLTNRPLPADVAADAFRLSGAARRRKIEKELGENKENEKWRREFAARLAATATTLTRRNRGLLTLLAREFSDVLDAAALLPLVPALLASESEELTELARTGARNADPKTALDWLRAASGNETIIAALENAMRGKVFDATAAARLTQDAEETVRVGGWRLLAASATGEIVVGPLWLSLLDSLTETPILRTAMTSPAALSLWTRAGIDAQTLTSRLETRPFLVQLLSPATFASLARTVPAALTLRLISAASDELWAQIRPVWLRDLRGGVGVESLWLAAEAALRSTENDVLERRLLGDADIAQTLLGVENLAILDIRDDAFASILTRWLAGRAGEFPANSGPLLQAATHPLPAVRDWALARAMSFGLTLPFALRLLESNLPSSVETGQAFFDAAPPEKSSDFALAICDSPQKSVRAFGRQFAARRFPGSPPADFLRALFQNSHSDMQAFVAENLTKKSEIAPEETSNFDRDVLRARQKSRRAKEQIKARQSAGENLDAGTLLTLARGKTQRDAEWAMAELAKRALAGEAIDGVSVENMTGI